MKRKYEKIKNYPGIYRVLVSIDGKTWSEPVRGSMYAASRYENSNKKRSKKHFDTFEAAKKFRSRLDLTSTTASLQQVSVQSEPSKKSYLFQQALELYERTTLAHKANSTQARHVGYKKHLSFFNDMDVESIDTLVIDQWISWLKRPEYIETQQPTRCTFKSEVTVLRNILNTYTSRINRNYRMPFIKEHRAAIKYKQPKMVVKDLTPDEFRRFLDELRKDCLGKKWAYIYYVALAQYFTFSRVQDATALHYEDFDFNRGQITVRHKLELARSRKETTTLHDGGKANGGKIIPMSELAAHAFREWTGISGVTGGPLFCVNGSWPVYRQLSYRYTKALKRAGIAQSATHVLRHASLTEAQATSGDLNKTKMLAGHSSIKTTERYAKVRYEDLREAQKEFDKKMSAALHGSHWFANR